MVVGGTFVVAIAGQQAMAAISDALQNGSVVRTFSDNSENIDISPTTTTIDEVQYNITKLIFNTNAGYFSGGNHTLTFAGAVQIGVAGATDTGLIISNGNQNNVAKFTGEVTGTGKIQKTGAGTPTSIWFAGDVSKYTGSIVLGSSNTFTLKFSDVNNSTAEAGVSGTGDISFTSGNNTLVYDYSAGGTVYITNAIGRNGGTVKINLSGTDAVEFTKSIATDNIAVNSSAVTFAAGSAISGLTMTGSELTVSASGTSLLSLSVAEGKTLTLNGAILPETVTNAGTLNLSGTINLASSTGVAGMPTTNGWVTGTVYTVVTGAGTTNAADAKWTIDGNEVAAGTYNFTNGQLVMNAANNVYAIVEANSNVSSDSAATQGADGFRITSTGAGSTLNLVGVTSNYSAGVTVEANATIVAGAGSEFNQTMINRTGGTLNLNVTDGGKFTVAVGGEWPLVNGNLSVFGGGVAYLSNGDALGWGGTATKAIILEGDSADKLAQVVISHRQTASTNVVLKGDTLISTATEGADALAGLDMYGGTITATGTNNTIATGIWGRNDHRNVTIDVTGATDELLISGPMKNRQENSYSNVTKTGAGVLTCDNAENAFNNFTVSGGSVEFAKNTVIHGALSIASGTELNLTGGTTTLAGVTTIQGKLNASGGALKVNDISSLQGGALTFTDADGNPSANGYSTGTYYVLKYDGEGASSDLTSVTVGSEALTASSDATGLYVYSADNSSWWVNTEMNYADIDAEIAYIKVNVGGTLNMTSTAAADTASMSRISLEAGTSQLILQNGDGADLLRLHAASPFSQTVEGTTVLSNDSGYAGNITVLSGATLKNKGDANDRLGVNYMSNTSRIITIANGGTLDVNGKEAYYHVVLEEGAKITNTGAGVGVGNRQLPVVDLNGDAEVNAANGEFGIVFSGHNVSTLNLNGHQLTKTGDNTFLLRNTNTSAGSISVQEGTLQWLQGTVAANTDFEIAGGTLSFEDTTDRSIKSLAVSANGSVSVNGGRTLTVTGDATGVAGATLTKSGDGTLALAGVCSSNVSVTAGILDISNATSFVDANLQGNGGSVRVGSISPAAGEKLTLSGSVIDFHKTGEGTVDISAATLGGQITMNYDGPLTLGGTQLANDSTLVYGTGGANLLSMALTSAHTGLSLDFSALTEQDLADGVNLGLTWADEATLAEAATALGVEVNTLSIVDGHLQYALTIADEIKAAWDTNWGVSVLKDAPQTLPVAAPTATLGLAGNETYDNGTYVAVELNGGGGNGVLVYGGANADAASAVVSRDTWIRVSGGTWNAIVGGSYANNWDGGTKCDFTGDSHIVIDGATVGTIIGGNYKDGHGANFTGDSYISVFDGSTVNGAIIGASTQAHNNSATFRGDSHIYVYALLGAGDARLVFEASDMINGGSAWLTNVSGGITMVGDAHVTVDTSAVATAGTFNKHVIGANVNVGDKGVSQTLTGDTYVDMTMGAHTMASRVIGGSWLTTGTNNVSGTTHVTLHNGTYNTQIIGAHYMTGNGTANVGATELTIEDGTYKGVIIGGSHLASQGTANVTNGVTMTISGGSFAENVIGGNNAVTGTATHHVGGITMNLNGGTFNKDIIGGSNQNGTGSVAITASTGDILVSVDGATVKGTIYGGSYTQRNHADSTITQGDIVVDLKSGVVNGDVYAAGRQDGTTKHSTASTTVKVGDDVTFTDGKTLSGGYQSVTTSTITGSTTLEFSGATGADLSNMVITGFDTIAVTQSTATATVGAITPALNMTKTGAGRLNLSSDLASAVMSMSVSEGTLGLTGSDTYSILLLTVADGATLAAGGASLTQGQLILNEGATLDLSTGATNSALNLNSGVLKLSGKAALTLAGVDSEFSDTLVLLEGVAGIVGADDNALTFGESTNLSDYFSAPSIDGAYLEYDATAQTLSLVGPAMPNVLMVKTTVAYEPSLVTDEMDTVRISGGTLQMGNDALDADLVTLEVTRSGAIEATGTVSEIAFTSVSISDEQTLTLQDGGTDLTVKTNGLTLADGASIAIEEGQTLDLTKMSTKDAFMSTLSTTSGDGTVKLDGGDNFNDNVANRVDMRDVGYGQVSTTSVGYHIDGKFALNSYVKQSSGPANSLAIAKDFTVTDEFRLETLAVVQVIGGTLSAGSIGLGHTNGGDTVVLNLKDSGAITTTAIKNTRNSGSHNFKMNGGTLTISSDAGIAAGINTTITGGTLATDGADWGMTNASVGGASISGTNAITMNGGTLTGAMTIKDGATFKTTGTINVNGSFGLPSGFVIYSEGVNGYFGGRTEYTIFEFEGTGKVVDNATWKLAGASEGVTYVDGKIQYDYYDDLATYYVNSGEVVYDLSTDGDVVADTTESIVLFGGTLVLKDELRDGVSLRVDESSGIKITSDITLAQSSISGIGNDLTVKVSGAGTYALGNSAELTTGVDFGDDWSGWVSLNGASATSDELAHLTTEAGRVSLTGTTITAGSSTAIGGELKLVDALTVQGTSETAPLSIAGKLSGDGDIAMTGGQTVELSGDNTAWNGAVTNTGDKSTLIVGSDLAADITGDSIRLEVTEGENVSMTGVLSAVTEIEVGSGATLEVPGNVTTEGMSLSELSGAGQLVVTDGDLTLSGKSSIGDLTITNGDLNLDLSSLGVDGLLNWAASDQPWLTVNGTLNANSVVALTGKDLLLSMGNNQTVTLAEIQNGLGGNDVFFTDENGNPVTELEVISSTGFKYKYSIDTIDSVTTITLTSALLAQGWIADDTDTSTDADTTWSQSDAVGDGKWMLAVGGFYGFGNSDVTIDAAGVDAGDVIVDASAGTIDYTFSGGQLTADTLTVHQGSLTLDTDVTLEGAEGAEIALNVNGAGELTINTDATLAASGKDMIVNDTATMTNDGTLTGIGTLGVAATATVTNNGTMENIGELQMSAGATITNTGSISVGSLNASGATIDGSGTLTTVGGTIGAMTGDGVLNNSGALVIEGDTDLKTLANTGTIQAAGTLTVIDEVTSTGDVSVENMTLANGGDFGKLVSTGTVQADNLAVGDGSSLTVVEGYTAGTNMALTNKGGDVILAQDATLASLTNKGSLTAQSLTVESSVTEGGTIHASNLTVQGTAQITEANVVGTLSADSLAVTNGTVGALDTTSVSINESGLLSVRDSVALDTLSGAGMLHVTAGDLTLNNAVTNGGDVKAQNVTFMDSAVMNDVAAEGAGSVTATQLTAHSVTAGTLAADAVVLGAGSSSVGTLNVPSLTINNDGSLVVANNVALDVLSGNGSLTVGSTDGTLILNKAVDGQVNVAASTLVLQVAGSTMGNLSADTVVLTSNIALDTENAIMTVTDAGALNGDAVTIELSDETFSSFTIGADGSYDAADYLVMNGISSADVFAPITETQLQTILQTGKSVNWINKDGTLALSIAQIVNEDGSTGLIWDATGGNNVADNGYKLDTGAGFYKALDYVSRVELAGERTFDLSSDIIGDSEPGNATNPALGLLVRNLRLAEGATSGTLTVKGNDTASDVVTFINTDATPADAALGLVLDGVKANIGMPDGETGVMEGDDTNATMTLSSLKLANKTHLFAYSDVDVLGDTEVTESARLMMENGTVLRTSALNGHSSAKVGGQIQITGAGTSYDGGYTNADVEVLTGASARLRAGRGLDLAIHQGASVVLDYNGTDSFMNSLMSGISEARVNVGSARRAVSGSAAELTLLNTSEKDGAVSHYVMTLSGTDSNIVNTTVNMSLGAAETAESLGSIYTPVAVDGTLSITGSALNVNMIGDAAKSAVLNVTTERSTDLVLARLMTSGSADNNTVTLTGTPEMMALIEKYYTNARMDAQGAILVDRVTDYYSSKVSVSETGNQGLALLDNVLVKVNPQAKTEDYSALAGVLDAVEADMAAGNIAAVDTLASAVTGASVAALGSAINDDMERQLRAIRNRTTTMGVDQCAVHHDMPYFNAWINAEGTHRELDRDGMMPGYTLDSWGGTVGFDVDMTPRLTFGVALSVMHGNFTADSADMAEGDLDSIYVTGFARYAAHRWVHTFVASVGSSQTSLERTVNYGQSGYTTEGDSDATSFGFMYEVGYVMALDPDSTACLQPIFNVTLTQTSLGGYTESGSDAALTLDGVDMTTLTFGLGARFQKAFGANVFNRTSLLETRALLKARTGDCGAEVGSSFKVAPGATANVKSAEAGTLGAELGVGLTVPLGADSGSIFADFSVDLGSGYTSLNGTVGYRVNF